MKKIKLEQFLKEVEINEWIVIFYEEERTLYDYETLTKKEWNKLKNMNIINVCINNNAIQLTIQKGE